MNLAGEDRMLFQQRLGPHWVGYGAVAYGKVVLYAINHTTAGRFDIDPDTGQVVYQRGMDVPEKVYRTMLQLARGLPTANNFIHGATSWLFKWDSRDHAYEIATGDWDPRDL